MRTLNAHELENVTGAGRIAYKSRVSPLLLPCHVGRWESTSPGCSPIEESRRSRFAARQENPPWKNLESPTSGFMTYGTHGQAGTFKPERLRPFFRSRGDSGHGAEICAPQHGAFAKTRKCNRLRFDRPWHKYGTRRLRAACRQPRNIHVTD